MPTHWCHYASSIVISRKTGISGVPVLAGITKYSQEKKQKENKIPRQLSISLEKKTS